MQYFKTISKITMLSLHKNISPQYKLYYAVKQQSNTKKSVVYGVLTACTQLRVNKVLYIRKKRKLVRMLCSHYNIIIIKIKFSRLRI